MTLRELYAEHTGKVSDKWSLYLSEYERIFAAYRDKPVRLFEIGIQNGGSLEIWSRYFPAAQKLVGCDINPDCEKLRYDDPRITLVVGDANTDVVDAQIAPQGPFDIVIDDGSHRSSDIVRSFARWFPRVVDGGVYVVEDLHCSFWHAYEGGLHAPTSSLSFFKAVSDITGHEHWGLARSRHDELANFVSVYGVTFDEEELAHIHSVEFINSICVIRKRAPADNVLGQRVLAGRDALVVQSVVAAAGSSSATPAQEDAGWQSMSAERDALRSLLDARDAEITQLRQTLRGADAELDRVRRKMSLMAQSTSWKITKPMRTTSHAVHRRVVSYAPRVWRRIPARYHGPLLNLGFGRIRSWFVGSSRADDARPLDAALRDLISRSNQLVDISTRAPLEDAPGTIAIHLHVFYEDLAEELRGYVANMPFAYDLYVTVANDVGERVCRRVFAGLERCGAVHVRQVPNRGRDIAAMFCGFGKELARYDFVAHLHSKKSLYNKGATDGWRQYLANGLLGSEAQIRRIFGLLTDDAPRGICYPQNFHRLPYACNTWLANRALGSAWCKRLGFELPVGYFDFPAGSMFWARGDALKPLFDANITLDDFAPEGGQTDGTFAHTLERLLVLCARKQGMQAAILADTAHAAWSPWRFDQYLRRSREWLVGAFDSSRVIAFDIYDTLLSRPLLDPEATKQIVARRIGGEIGALYLRFRALAEEDARAASDRDVGMDAIYDALQRRGGFSADTMRTLRSTEEMVERVSVAPRADLVALYRDALRSGRPVILLSDMFLPRELIEASLRENGIDEWHALFVSSDVGVRKDTGALYEHVFERYDITPDQMVMVGDSERSDLQIPSERGVVGHHVLRPLELARGWPRFAPLIERYERTASLDVQLTLGLVVRESFARFVPPFPEPSSLLGNDPRQIGYGVVGPLLVAFSEWLLEAAQRDEVASLYFVAREGRFMRRVFSEWCEGRSRVPHVRDLVLSRRAVGVPLLSNIGDIIAAAKPNYWPGAIDAFLQERFGLKLDAARWVALGWDPARTVQVLGGDLGEVAPLLDKLTGDILREAERERDPLRRYLARMELDESTRHALVDVGYSGTIQGYLNRLLAQRVHGYYMMTNEHATRMAAAHDVAARGCYVEGVTHRADAAPRMYLQSFNLEKLLSSDDPQVLRYELDARGEPKPVFRTLSVEEKQSASVRAAVQEGALHFVADARRARGLLPDWRPSTEVAQALFEALVASPSVGEVDVLRSIALDDHHHGRGVVR